MVKTRLVRFYVLRIKTMTYISFKMFLTYFEKT